MHAIANTATKYVAAIGMETATINGIYAVANGISEGLTGEPLHGASLVATTVVAAGVGISVGFRTYDAVDDGLKMIDEWRLKNAEELLENFSIDDEEDDDAVDSE